MISSPQLERRDSDLIGAMRFPLIVLVLFVHILPFEEKPIVISLDFHNTYVFVSEFISHNLGRLAVPCFFLFSGFLFFNRNTSMSHDDFYFGQIKKKAVTLLIPYFLWNLLAIIAFIIRNRVFAITGIESATTIRSYSSYELFWSMPINFPLWYLRDLICMTLLTPIFYTLFQYLKIIGLLILLLLYIGFVESPVPGLSSTALFFFGAGAYLRLNNKSLLGISNQIKNIAYVSSILFLVISIRLNGTSYHEYFIRLFIIIGVIASINLTGEIIKNKKIKERCLKLAPPVFFIYAVHEIYIINWLKGSFYRLPIAFTDWGSLLGYFLIPIVCTFICLSLYYIIKMLFPKMLEFSVGGRRTVEK